METEKEQELWERIFTLEDKRYLYLNKLENILNELYKTHITIEEFEKIVKLVEGE